MVILKQRLQISLRLLLLAVSFCAVCLSWLHVREQRLRAEHESAIVNLRTRLLYVDGFREDLRERLSDPDDKERAILRAELAEYDRERTELLNRMKWR